MDDETPAPLEEIRPPSDEDLVKPASKLNELRAKSIVVGGFAVMAAGFTRSTVDIDLLVDCSPKNYAKAWKFYLIRRFLKSAPVRSSNTSWYG